LPGPDGVVAAVDPATVAQPVLRSVG
jgi:hypothetical protein